MSNKKKLWCYCFGLVFLAGSLGMQFGAGPHGGILKKTGNHHIEINGSDRNFYCWLLDENTKSISNKNISCDVRFFFPDNTILDSEARPFGEDGFIIENSNPFLSCQVTFHVQGQSVSAKFESISPVVREK